MVPGARRLSPGPRIAPLLLVHAAPCSGCRSPVFLKQVGRLATQVHSIPDSLEAYNPPLAFSVPEPVISSLSLARVLVFTPGPMDRLHSEALASLPRDGLFRLEQTWPNHVLDSVSDRRNLVFGSCEYSPFHWTWTNTSHPRIRWIFFP